MSIVNILVGLPGSGKTTYARYLEEHDKCVRISKDDFVHIPSRIPVEQRMKDAIVDCLESNKDIVFDSTNITRQKRSWIVKLAREHNAQVNICLLDISAKKCKKQNEKKPTREQVSEQAIDRMEQAFMYPEEDEYDTIQVINSKWFSNHSKSIKKIIDNDDKYKQELKEKINKIRFGL